MTTKPRHALPILPLALALAGCSAREGLASDELVLSDGTGATAVVAPEAGGRVMAFHPAGTAGTRNVFWTNPLDDPTMAGWPNVGGEKTWIGPQSRWRGMAGKAWPPPAFFDRERYEIVHGATNGAATIRSPAPPESGDCPFAVERAFSLAGGVLRVESRLVPARDAGAPADADGFVAWSVAQTPHARRVAAQLAPPARFENGTDGDSPLPEPATAGDGVLVFDLDALAVSNGNGKAYFDADAIAAEFPDGTLVARRVPAPDDPDPASVPFPEHARAELYAGQLDDRPDLRYLEIEFTATGTRPLRVEYSFLPGVPCEEAIPRP